MEKKNKVLQGEACVIVDKVFSSCSQRVCFPEIEVKIEKLTVSKIKFEKGFIVPSSLKIEDILGRPNFKRVKFILKVPFIIELSNGIILKGFLPDICKDVVLYLPSDSARDEFKFNIVVETNSNVISQPITKDSSVVFAVGVFIIIKVVGKVQLLIPELGYCPTPPECEEFEPDNPCDDFKYEPFPDFFPPQLKNDGKVCSKSEER